ncbi:TRAP transporter small permease [Neobacillus vireti]|uniref:TRAP transporter small permease n=1 Tax=Neobacillus vireti TaxID=220686 RepID=UPI00300050E0
MRNTFNVIRSLTKISMYLGFATLVLMVLLLTASSISRNVGSPILGDVELSTLLMVVLIFLAIPYTQNMDGHVKIGLLVDHFPQRIQKCLDIISSVLTFFFAIMISVVYYHTAVELFIENPQFSDLLGIPLYPFKFLIVFSTILWALECALKVVEDVLSLVKNRVKLVENVTSLGNSQVEKVGE